MKTRRRLVLFGALALAFVTVGGVTAVTATAKKAPQLKGSISADGSSTVGPWTIAAAEMYPEDAAEGRGHRRHLGHRRRVRALLPRRDRPLQRVAPDQGVRERELSEERDQVGGVHRRERRHHDRHEQAEHMGDLPHDGRAQEDLEHRVERRQLEGHSSRLPGRPLKLFGPGTDSGTFDFFTEFINGKGEGEPLGLHRQRGRQHPRAGRVGHARRPRLLRPLVLRGKQEPAERRRRSTAEAAASSRPTRPSRPGRTSRSRAVCTSTRSGTPSSARKFAPSSASR